MTGIKTQLVVFDFDWSFAGQSNQNGSLSDSRSSSSDPHRPGHGPLRVRGPRTRAQDESQGSQDHRAMDGQRVSRAELEGDGLDK